MNMDSGERPGSLKSPDNFTLADLSECSLLHGASHSGMG